MTAVAPGGSGGVRLLV